MKKYLLFCFITLLVVMPGILAEPPSVLDGLNKNILVVYPHPKQTINAANTFLLGACSPKEKLFCNGHPVRLNAAGYFAHTVYLKPGNNYFVLQSNHKTLSLMVFRASAPSTLPARPLQCLLNSVVPGEDCAIIDGDVIPLAVRASPKARVSVRLANRKIILYPNNLAVNLGPDVAYGRAYQREPIPRDLYTGFYQISSLDHFQKLKPEFVITSGKKSLVIKARGSFTTLEQLLLARTTHSNTTVRLGPDAARSTPLDAGVRLTIDGWQGNWVRCRLVANRHIWIERKDLIFKNEPTILPQALVKAASLTSTPQELVLSVPLNQRLPYEIEQGLSPNHLTLRIFGATSDLDWLKELSSPQDEKFYSSITGKQPCDGICEFTVCFKGTRQWGFWTNYQGTTLTLHIKKPPSLYEPGRSLQGLIVCIDPGHGGNEPGAFGPPGTPEQAVNLAIAFKLKELLLKEKVRVIMTRTREDTPVSLDKRCKIAIESGANVLISIHNNALPDWGNPWIEQGTSTYWYHPQSRELACALQKSTSCETHFCNYGTFYDSLALTRPSQMLAVLVEVGFFINPDEFCKLTRSDIQEKAALGILKGLKSYFGQVQ